MAPSPPHRLSPHTNWLITALGNVVLALACFLAGIVSLQLNSAHIHMPPVWLASGVGIGVLVLWGRRFWPGVFLGLLLLNFKSALPWPVAAGVAASGTLAAFLAWRLLRYQTHFRPSLSRVRDVTGLILVGGLPATLAGALLASGSLVLGGLVSREQIPGAFLNWWAASFIGTLIVAPVILAWSQPGQLPSEKKRWLEVVLLALSCLGMSWWLFLLGGSDNYLHGLPFYVFPLIIWAALRFGPRAASATILFISCMAIWGTVQGTGPFGLPHGAVTVESSFMLQGFLGVISIISLLLSATTTELFEGTLRLQDSERRYRQIFETNPDAMWVHDQATMQILGVNEQAVTRYGYSREEFARMTFLDLLTEQDPRQTIHLFAAGKYSHRTSVDGRLRTKDGQIVHVRLISRPIDFSDQPAILLLAEDVTDQIRTKRDLHRSEQTLNLHIQQTAVGVIEWDENFRVAHWNPAAEKIFGYTEEEALGVYGPELIVPLEIHPDMTELWEKLQTRQHNLLNINENVTKSGRRITCEWFNTPLVDQTGHVFGVASLVQDITARETAEETIRESEEKFRSIVESSPMGIQIYEVRNGRRLVLIGANTAAQNFMGAQNEDVLGKTIEEAFPALAGTDIPGMYLRAALEGHASWTDQVIYHEGEFRGAYEVNAFQTVPGKMVAMFLDVTERRRTEQALRLRDKAMEAISQGIVIIDHLESGALPIIYANPAFEKISGFSSTEIIGKSWRALTGPESEISEVHAIEKAIRREHAVSVEMKSYRRDRTTFQSSISISPILDADGRVTHFVGVFTDVSSIKRLEAQFRQSQKMDAIGRLAGGVAHDFNNLLTAIIGYNDLNLSQLQEGSALRGNSGEIQKAAERAAALTGQMLAFSRQQNLQPTRVDLNRLISGMYSMLARLIGETIEIRTLLEDGLGHIRAGSSQIEQVVLNLAINARDAMPAGGVLTIHTRQVTLGEDLFQETSTIPPGEYILLSVADTGSGMDDHTKEHLFEPFFTTKEKGKGTGLGLATCYGIITQSGGHVTVQSELNKGTAFDIYFPMLEQETDRENSRVPEIKVEGGAETILVVEDDPAVRPLTTNILRRLGYTVLDAGDGVEAQECLHRLNGTHLDLLLTDVVMPRMGGKELADWMKTSHPGTQILFASGYLENLLSEEDIGEDEAFFLRKPFTAKTLAKKVREVLDLAKDASA